MSRYFSRLQIKNKLARMLGIDFWHFVTDLKQLVSVIWVVTVFVNFHKYKGCLRIIVLNTTQFLVTDFPKTKSTLYILNMAAPLEEIHGSPPPPRESAFLIQKSSPWFARNEIKRSVQVADTATVHKQYAIHIMQEINVGSRLRDRLCYKLHDKPSFL